jgi:cytochrome b561
MSGQRESFSPLQRGLHWAMAIMVIAMLFIGVGMMTTLHPVYLALVAIHKPLGIALLMLALIRAAVRFKHGTPALPDDLPRMQHLGAQASHLMLYALLFLQPLLGWGMLSAGGYPVVLYGPVRLPPIAPHSDSLHTLLRSAHTWCAYLLFATVVLHLAAALFHGLIRRDGVLQSILFRKQQA